MNYYIQVCTTNDTGKISVKINTHTSSKYIFKSKIIKKFLDLSNNSVGFRTRIVDDLHTNNYYIGWFSDNTHYLGYPISSVEFIIFNDLTNKSLLNNVCLSFLRYKTINYLLEN
jgi:hypothetical protein